MPIHKLKLIDRYEAARDTVVFVFEKPEGFTFKPGQYGGLTLINPSETDASGITRRFSFLNAPDDQHLLFATRMHKNILAYKRVLNQLPLGSEIKLAGPTGNFVLHDDIKTPAVMIAGGIGITPFYSMIQHATKHKSSQPLYLFYGNTTREEAAFLDELKTFQQQNPHFQLIATLDKPSNDWQGETGYVNRQMIQKYIHSISTPIYYICGSPSMVTGVQEMLAEMNINEDRILVEDFPGY